MKKIELAYIIKQKLKKEACHYEYWDGTRCEGKVEFKIARKVKRRLVTLDTCSEHKLESDEIIVEYHM